MNQPPQLTDDEKDFLAWWVPIRKKKQWHFVLSSIFCPGWGGIFVLSVICAIVFAIPVLDDGAIVALGSFFIGNALMGLDNWQKNEKELAEISRRFSKSNQDPASDN